MRSSWRYVGLLLGLGLTSPSAGFAVQQSGGELTPQAFEFERWAKFVVRDFFDTQPYERYVLMFDPSYYPEFVDALRAEFLEARAVEHGTILFDGRRVAERRGGEQPRATDSEYKRLSNERMRRLFEEADIFLWLPYRYGDGSERGDRRLFEHLIEGTGARGLHFHWVWLFDDFGTGPERQAQIDSLSRTYADALDVDYGRLSAHQDRVIAAMRDSRLRITTPLGTDLRMRVNRDSWFHKNDGRMDRERAVQARAVRDREMELPAGALRFIPDVTTVEGVLVAPEWRGGRNVRFEFRGGRITDISAEENQEAVLGAWSGETGDKDRLAEIVVGTNPKLPRDGPGWLPPYFGYGAGVLRIALGENWESGGTNRSSMEAWFWFVDASVFAGGTTIVEGGRLVLE